MSLTRGRWSPPLYVNQVGLLPTIVSQVMVRQLNYKQSVMHMNAHKQASHNLAGISKDDNHIQADIIHLHIKALQRDMMTMYPSLSKCWNCSWVVTLESQKIEKWHRKSKSQKASHAWTDGDAGQMIQGEALNQNTSLWKKMVSHHCERMRLRWTTARLKMEAKE